MLPGNLAPSVPTGKPTNAEFPTSASIPPVNIMTPEPPLTPQAARPPPVAAKLPRAGAAHRRCAGTATTQGCGARPARSNRPRARRLVHEQAQAPAARACVRLPRTPITELRLTPVAITSPESMPLHLIKLSVGCDSIKEFKGWIAERMRVAKKNGTPQHHVHVTRMMPKRDAELLDGGSIYWVIRGEIAVREKIWRSSRFATAPASTAAGW